MRLPIFTLLTAALALNAQNGANSNAAGKQVALGAQLATEFRRQHPRLNSQRIADYIQQVGARLVAPPLDTPFSFHFEVTADSGATYLEPAALPGGYVFVPAGLILAAQDEGELGGIMAHSIAHVLARHGTAQLATIPLIFMGSWTGYGVQDSHTLIPIAALQSQRTFELEADRLGATIAAGAGYDPEALARYIGRVQPDLSQGASLPLPPRDERIQAIERVIQTFPVRNYAASGDFPRIQQEVRRILSAASPALPSQPPSLKQN